ncbi:MAG: DUF4276 family protein [Anaerolineales bacterium]
MSYSRRVVCFCEDIAHERFIRALIHRAAEVRSTPVEIQVLNATHGSRVWREFRQYLREIKKGRQSVPDVLVVVIDGNCKTPAQVRRDIQEEVKKRGLEIPHLVCAVPDPHIERWYVEDQQALKSILPGAKPEKLPYKCERDRYKQGLKNAIRAAGVEPSLGGAEYGEDVGKALEPSRLDDSFRSFWNDLLAAL